MKRRQGERRVRWRCVGAGVDGTTTHLRHGEARIVVNERSGSDRRRATSGAARFDPGATSSQYNVPTSGAAESARASEGEAREARRHRYVYEEIARRYAKWGFDLDEMVDGEIAALAGDWVDAKEFFEKLEAIAREHDPALVHTSDSPDSADRHPYDERAATRAKAILAAAALEWGALTDERRAQVVETIVRTMCPGCGTELPAQVGPYGYHFCGCGWSWNEGWRPPRKEKT